MFGFKKYFCVGQKKKKKCVFSIHFYVSDLFFLKYIEVHYVTLLGVPSGVTLPPGYCLKVRKAAHIHAQREHPLLCFLCLVELRECTAKTKT